MRVLVAPDKFKGTLTAEQAARALAAGIREQLPDAELIECPLADGGEGSHEAALRAGFVAAEIRVADAIGVPRHTSYARRGNTALLELARLCGGPTLGHGPDPWHATTLGLGEGIGQAICDGATEIVLCLGGSASVDGGAGLLHALGYHLLDAADQPIAPTLAGLARIVRIQPPPRPLPARVFAVCDVANPLLGGNGGVRVFSAQKGLPPDEIVRAEQSMHTWAAAVRRLVGGAPHRRRGAGAAGGAGFAALACLGARYLAGLDYFARLTRLAREIRRADVVLTGEGAFDLGSLGGKVPVAVARRTGRAGKPCLLVAGRIDLAAAQVDDLFRHAWAVSDCIDPKRAMAQPEQSLRAVGGEVGRWLHTHR